VPKKLCLLIVFLSMTTLAFAQGESEQLTITTYYPSPYGVYKTLRIFPYNDAPPTCNPDNRGLLYYSGDWYGMSGGISISSNVMYWCDGLRWISMFPPSNPICPQVLVRCRLPSGDHLTWVDNQNECTNASGTIENTTIIMGPCII